jgi:hypothetical protein
MAAAIVRRIDRHALTRLVAAGGAWGLVMTAASRATYAALSGKLGRRKLFVIICKRRTILRSISSYKTSATTIHIAVSIKQIAM